MGFNCPDDYDQHWRQCELCKLAFHPAGEGSCSCTNEELEAFYVERREERKRAHEVYQMALLLANQDESP